MVILLLAAMDKEISLLTNLLENIQIEEKDFIQYWKGSIGDKTVYISKCGIGKVNSALNTAALIRYFKPDMVINSGVAGGAGIPIGSILVADKVAYHDVWCGPGTYYGQADGFPLFMKPSSILLELINSSDIKDEVKIGLICSGDKFISEAEEISFIRSKFPDVMAVDMESASISQTCIKYDTPFAIIRVVSDTPGEGENISQYKDFWDKAPLKSFMIISKILKFLK